MVRPAETSAWAMTCPPNTPLAPKGIQTDWERKVDFRSDARPDVEGRTVRESVKVVEGRILHWSFREARRR